MKSLELKPMLKNLVCRTALVIIRLNEFRIFVMFSFTESRAAILYACFEKKFRSS